MPPEWLNKDILKKALDTERSAAPPPMDTTMLAHNLGVETTSEKFNFLTFAPAKWPLAWQSMNTVFSSSEHTFRARVDVIDHNDY